MKHLKRAEPSAIVHLTYLFAVASETRINGAHCLQPQNRTRLALIFAFFLSAFLSPGARAQVLTSQYDNARTGSDLHETILSPQNVNVRQFGKLFTFHVDGAVYAQPLYIPGLDIPGKGKHNAVFVATEHDSVYAFDADGQSAEPLWKVSLLNPKADARPVPESNVGCGFISPEVGITSTPVIDYLTGTLYVLARTMESSSATTRFVQRLHALALATGAEKSGGPVEIQASVSGQGDGSSSGQVRFDPLRENPRAALLLARGVVYLTWASSCDVGPYHGWMMAYDSHSLKQLAVFNATPNAGEGGFWAGDTGPAADAEGNVYAATGNGAFDATARGRDYGDTVLKLRLNEDGLLIRDYFTPYNQAQLNARDKDFGSGGPVLFPGLSLAHSHLLAIAGKGGTLYVVDRDKMGGFHDGDDSHAVWTILDAGAEAFGAPSYWNDNLYFLESDHVLKDFLVTRAGLKLVAESGPRFGDPGATPTISSDGSHNGIVWVLTSKHWTEPDGRPAVLYAFDASNVAHELYNSEKNSGRDRAGIGLRFNIPMVANGRVYVGAKGELDVYGLISPAKQAHNIGR